MESNGSAFAELLDVLGNQGTYIGAGTALILFLLEVILDFRRKGEKRNLFDNAKSVVLLAAAGASIFYAFVSLQNQYEPVSEATRARRDIVSYYERCRERAVALDDATKAEIVASRVIYVPDPGRRARLTTMLLQLDCLALALGHAPAGDDQRTQLGWLNKDVALGLDLLSAPAPENANGEPIADASIADTLYLLYGINSEDYLGIGRSLPVTNDLNRSRYSEAVMREYWAPNQCATTGRAEGVCERRWPRAWGWTLQGSGDFGTMTLRELIMTIPPDSGGDTPEFARLKERLGREHGLEQPTELLVRFHTFPANFYVGTTGRPEARQVFFSSLADSIDLPVSEAFVRSGARDPAQLNQFADDNTAFVWVYEPNTVEEYRLATWRNLFALLRSTPVDPRIREAAEARNWAAPRPAPQPAPQNP
jgi:hypothetical protein